MELGRDNGSNDGRLEGGEQMGWILMAVLLLCAFLYSPHITGMVLGCVGIVLLVITVYRIIK
jgi:hypothetical protein